METEKVLKIILKLKKDAIKQTNTELREVFDELFWAGFEAGKLFVLLKISDFLKTQDFAKFVKSFLEWTWGDNHEIRSKN